MLSQRPEDLPPDSPDAAKKPIRDVPSWVRRTHVARLERVSKRLFENTPLASLLEDSVVRRAFSIAKAHDKWPWHWTFVDRDSGLAALLAVADLLDEDSARCDSATLLHHRFGTAENCAHWIRHSLTAHRVLVRRGRVSVSFARPPGTDMQLDPIFVALRNHYRLVRLYLNELRQVDASILSVDFDPPHGGPQDSAPNLPVGKIFQISKRSPR